MARWIPKQDYKPPEWVLPLSDLKVRVTAIVADGTLTKAAMARLCGFERPQDLWAKIKYGTSDITMAEQIRISRAVHLCEMGAVHLERHTASIWSMGQKTDYPVMNAPEKPYDAKRILTIGKDGPRLQGVVTKRPSVAELFGRKK